MNTSYILQGSNIGNRLEILEKSKNIIAQNIGLVEKESLLYESEPWGFDCNNWFLNRVLQIKTDLSPQLLLKKLLQIEIQLGRVRNTAEKTYSSRSIDLDILYFNLDIINEKDLEIPHPKIHLRKFTLLPLCDIAPNFVHPILLLSNLKLLENCNDQTQVRIFNPEFELL